MSKPIVFLTGATGGMGMESLKAMLKDLNLYDLRILARKSEKNIKLLSGYENQEGLEICWGDLNDKEILTALYFLIYAPLGVLLRAGLNLKRSDKNA